jgi:hypothetical protein
MGRISKSGDAGVRTLLYEAANIILTRPVKGAALKSWAARIAGCARPRWRWPGSWRWSCTGCSPTAHHSPPPGRRRPEIEEEIAGSGGPRHQPPRARSRRRDEGSGQAATGQATPQGRSRPPRLAGLLLIRPHQVAAAAPTPDRSETPAIGPTLKRVDYSRPVTEGPVEYQGSREGADVVQAPQRSLRWIGFI